MELKNKSKRFLEGQIVSQNKKLVDPKYFHLKEKIESYLKELKEELSKRK